MEKKIPKKEAVIFTVSVVVIMLLVGTVLIAVGAEQLSWIGIVVAGIAGVLFFCKETGEKLDLREKIRSFDITVPLMIFLMSWSLCTVASYIYGLIASRFSSVGANENSSDLLSVLVISPVFEELMFRQCSQGISKRTGSKWFSLIFPTFAFALCHCFYNMQGMLNVFSGTIALAICFHYTENVLYTIIAHFLHNLFVTLDFTKFNFFGFFSVRDVNGYALISLPYLVFNIFILILSLFKRFIPEYRDIPAGMQFATK